LDRHPLPQLVAAGVHCSLSSDDPAMFDTSLEHEYATAQTLGLQPHAFYEAGLIGAICDDATRARLRAIGEAYDWSEAASSSRPCVDSARSHTAASCRFGARSRSRARTGRSRPPSRPGCRSSPPPV